MSPIRLSKTGDWKLSWQNQGKKFRSNETPATQWGEKNRRWLCLADSEALLSQFSQEEQKSKIWNSGCNSTIAEAPRKLTSRFIGFALLVHLLCWINTFAQSAYNIIQTWAFPLIKYQHGVDVHEILYTSSAASSYTTVRIYNKKLISTSTHSTSL